jgi:SNF2 family DNA or RNA helicase
MQYRSDEHFVYLIDTPFNKKEDMKQYLSGVWVSNKKFKGFRFPKNVHCMRELVRYFPELRENEEFVKDGKMLADESIYWMKNKNPTLTDIWRNECNKGLRLYQEEDVYYLKHRGSCLVLNEPRTGKTPTMITLLKSLGTKRNLVICPSSLVLNWAKEFKQWYPEIEVYAVTGTKAKRSSKYGKFTVGQMNKYKVLIVSKDTWKLDANVDSMMIGNYPFDTAIVDEAHFLRNYKSKQSEAIFKIKANYRFPLTGTPTVSHGSDIYGLLHFINPKQYTSYWQFTERYWEIQDNGWGKEIANLKKKRENELRRLMTLNSVQRKRQDVMQWLPKAQHQTIPVQLEGKQLKLYNQMLDTFMADDEETEHEIDTMNKLSQLMRLRQLCLDPRLLGFDVRGSKTDTLLEWAENNTDPFVVMTTFSSYFELVKPELEKLGKKVEVIDGSVTKSNRQRIVEDFQSGKVDILLANIIAAGTGLTLDRSDTIIFLDKSFNPADNEQAQDRIVPTTETRYHPINIISFIAQGTIDERVNEILDRKEDLTKIINKGELVK